MLLLDTDHFSEIFRGTSLGDALRIRLAATDRDTALTIISAEELTRGWLAQIAKAKTGPARQLAYDQFGLLLSDLSRWTIIPWSQQAEAIFHQRRGGGLRIGTLDLRIASIALSSDATVLTRNTKDFGRVHGLKFESWI